MGKSFSRSLFLGAVASVLFSAPSWGGDVSIQKDGATTWQAGVDGVEIEWKPDGSIKRLYSRYGQTVEFGDRRGISTAQIIAEEKAKGSIVRFMNQAVTSNRLVTEVEADLNKATQERQTGTAAKVTKVDQRTLVTALAEVTGSFAAGQLKGVIVLEKGYDEKTHEAWVVVGISDKTIKAAQGVQRMLTDSPGDPHVGSDSTGTQPSEVRKSNQKDF